MNELMQLSDFSFAVTCFYLFTAILSLIVFIWSRFKHTTGLIMFNKRMLTLWILILLFTGALMLGKTAGCIFFAVLSTIGWQEYQNLTIRIRQDKFKNPLIYMFLVAQYAALYFDMQIVFAALIPLAIFIIIPITGVLYRRNDIWQSCVADYVGLLLTVYAMSYMGAYICSSQMQNGTEMLVFVLILTLMSDFFQAICGFLWGKHYVVPTLSPHKTWEGLIGGGFLTAGLAYVMGRYLTPFGAVELLISGFVLNCCAFCGDITVSALKRSAGVKDSSNLLPGHGGLLDRFDSILFTAPSLFWYTVCCY